MLCSTCDADGEMAEVTSVVVEGRLGRSSADVRKLPNPVQRYIFDNFQTIDRDFECEVAGLRDNGRQLETSYLARIDTVVGKFVASGENGRTYSFWARGISGMATIIDAEPVLDSYLADELAFLKGQTALRALHHVGSRSLLHTISGRFTSLLSFVRTRRAPQFAGLLSPRPAAAAARTIIGKRMALIAPAALGGLIVCALVWGGAAAAVQAGFDEAIHATIAGGASIVAPGFAWSLGRRRLRRDFTSVEAGTEGARVLNQLDGLWFKIGVPAMLAALIGLAILASPA